MKRLAFLLFFFGLTHSGIAQEKYFHELKGMEDSSGTTHLFYRLYQGTVNEGRSFLSENHVYHYNSLLESDSILFKSGIDYTGLSYFSLTADYSFPDKDIQSGFHLNNTDDVFGNVYSFMKSANGSFFDAGLSWGDKIRAGYNDTLSFSISNPHQKSVLVITDNDRLPSVRYNYAILVKAHENEEICDAFANCDLGASDSVLFFHYNFLEIDNKTNRIFFSRNDSLFVSHDLGSSFLFLNDQFKWGEFQHFVFAEDETTLIATTENRYIINDEQVSKPEYKLVLSLDGGESWSEIISDTSRIQLSGPSLSPFSGFYVGVDTQLYYWDELSGELDLALTLEKPITGLYSSSNSDTEFILTTDELLALDPNTGETTILKVLSVSNETNPELPNRLQLHQNYPNPFNPSTIIPFELNQPSQVQLVVFDALGRQVAVLLDEHRSAGLHRVSFNASGLSSGVYFYELSSLTNGLKARRNMLFIK